MQIFVKISGWAEANMMTLDVEASDSIDLVRDKIQWEKSIPPDHQRFIFRGTQLEGRRPLSEYNIKHCSQLSLAIRAPHDLSTQVGCDFCEVLISQADDDYRYWPCERCAANIALKGEFDPTDYGTDSPPRKNRTR